MAEINKQKKELQATLDAAEYDLITDMEAQDLKTIGTEFATMTRNVKMYPQIKAGDMQELVDWCAENTMAELLTTRIKASVFEEYFMDTGELPAGIETFERTTLSVRRKNG